MSVLLQQKVWYSRWIIGKNTQIGTYLLLILSGLYSFLFRKVRSCYLKYSVEANYAKKISDSYFIKVAILCFFILSIHSVSIKFSVSFLSVSRLYFFFAGFLSRTCSCPVSTYFQISLNNLLSNKQTNKNRWKK